MSSLKKKQMYEKIRILIFAKQKTDRDKIQSTLSKQDNFDILGMEKDDFGTILRSELLKPDVLIIDIQFTMAEAPNLARMIRGRSPSTKIIFLSSFCEVELVGFSFKAGVSAFLLKENDFDKLVLIVNLVSMSGCYISESINMKLINRVLLINQFPVQLTEIKHELYTPAERCVVTAMASGYSDDDISDSLHLSPGTVKNCLTSVRKKIKLKSRIEIVIFSLVCGLIRLENPDFWKGKIEAIIQENIGERQD